MFHRAGGGAGVLPLRLWADEPPVPPGHPGEPDSRPPGGEAPPGAHQQLGGHRVRLRRGEAGEHRGGRRPPGH